MEVARKYSGKASRIEVRKQGRQDSVELKIIFLTEGSMAYLQIHLSAFAPISKN